MTTRIKDHLMGLNPELRAAIGAMLYGFGAGPPSDGVAAGVGSWYLDDLNGDWYHNVGSSQSAQWAPSAPNEGADVDPAGVVPVLIPILLASGADANVDVALQRKTRIVDAVFVLKGAGTTGSDIQVQNVTTAISDLIDVASGGDEAVFRPSTMADDQQEVAAGANLRVAYSSTSADFPGAEGYVLGYAVA